MVGICGKYIHIILQMQSTAHIDATLYRPAGFVTWCKPFYQYKYFLFIIAQSCYCCLPLYHYSWWPHRTPNIDYHRGRFPHRTPNIDYQRGRCPHRTPIITVVGVRTEHLLLIITVVAFHTEHLITVVGAHTEHLTLIY